MNIAFILYKIYECVDIYICVQVYTYVCVSIYTHISMKAGYK